MIARSEATQKKTGAFTHTHFDEAMDLARKAEAKYARGVRTGALESVIFVLSGHARMRWGDRLEFVADAFPGDSIFVPPYVPHQEINADPQNPLECVLVRSDSEAVVVNITTIDPVEPPEEVHWIDPIHRAP